MKMHEIIIVLTTYPDLDSAERAARVLVERSLAACVNVLPEMTSIYPWQGRIETGREHQLVIKTRRSLFGDIEACIMADHPYDLPELLALPVLTGSGDYLNWINESTHAQ